MKQEKVSCIIAARNEAERINSVLLVAFNHPLIDEIIVVQTFSTDNTSQTVKDFIKNHSAKNIKLIEDNKFPGKAYAMYLGVENSKNAVLLFLDADLNGLTKNNIDELVCPLTENKIDMTIGFMKDALWLYKLFNVDPICGQRSIKKDLFMKMPDCRYSKYGIESLQNDFLIASSKEIKIVKMPNVGQKRKYKKIGFFKGWLADIKMTKDIFSSVSIFKYTKMMVYLSKNAQRD